MFRLIRYIIERFKALFTLDAMLDLEQEFLARHAERRAELFRAADRYEKEGLTAIASDLRRQADELSEKRPLQTVTPFLGRQPDLDDALASLGSPEKSTTTNLSAAPSAPVNRLPVPEPVANGSRKKGR